MKPNKRLLILTRGLGGDLKRFHSIKYLNEKVNIKIISINLNFFEKLLNLLLHFSLRKSRWREKSKRNSYIFKRRSKNLGRQLSKIFRPKNDIILMYEALYSPGLQPNIFSPYIIYEDTTPRMTRRRWEQWGPNTTQTSTYENITENLYKKAYKLLASNDLCRKSFINDYGIDPKKVRTIYQGCNFPLGRDGVIKIENQILFVGYDFDLKGGKTLLYAFEKVKKHIDGAKLIVVGDNLNYKIKGARFLGKINDRNKLLQLYRESSIFVLPSLFDTFPNAAIEAMGVGLPTIVSDKSGTKEIIKNGENGFVVPAHNVSALADAIINVLSDQKLADKIEKNSVKTIKEKFNWEVISKIILEESGILM